MNVRGMAVLIVIGVLAVTWGGGCTSRPAQRGGAGGLGPSERARAFDQFAAASSDADEVWIIERSPVVAWPSINLSEERGLGDGIGVMTFRSDDGGTAHAAPERSAVHILIDDVVATVHLSQVFESPLTQAADAEYWLRIPGVAAVHDFLITIGERRIRAIIRERAEAEFLYGEAWRQGYRASRLTLDRKGELRAQVANIPPGARVGVDLRYRQPMARNGDTLMLHHPILLANGGARTAVAVEVNAAGTISDVEVSQRVAVHRPDGDPRRLNLTLLESGTDQEPFTLQYTAKGSAGRGGAPMTVGGPEDLDRQALRDGLLTPGTAFIAIDALKSGASDEAVVPISAP